MSSLLMNAIAGVAPVIAESEEPVVELSYNPVIAFWAILLTILFVSVFILINSRNTERQVAEYGLDQPQDDSGHGEHH